MTLGTVTKEPGIVLTTLPTRERFEEYFAAELERSRRFEYSLALIVITVSGIKAGQSGPMLRAVADACSGSIRAYDYACHMRDNQFAIMLPQTYNPGAREVARRVERQFYSTARQHGATGNPRLLIGVAAFPFDGDTVLGLFHAAEDDRMPSERAESRFDDAHKKALSA
jgi:diguanylate cyclase (GGDEF)-like protein